jgi:hypothetical protein
MTPVPARAASVIIELKFDPLHAGRAASVTNALPYRLARCSKYVLGIERLFATQPAVSSVGKVGNGWRDEDCLQMKR